MTDGNAPDPMTPDPATPGPTSAGPAPAAASREGAWGAVARLLALQLLTVVAVTAVITGIYALTGRHHDQAEAGSSNGGPTTSAPPASSPPSRTSSSTPTSTPSDTPSATSSPSTSPTTKSPPVVTHSLKVDVLNQSAAKGSAGKIATRVRALHWPVGRVDNFNGTVTQTTVYYPRGKAAAARELARGLPGSPRVLPRFSTLSDSRLTVIITR
jgi:cytoskeletal protein RodZ